jgi:hypothetical protein
MGEEEEEDYTYFQSIQLNHFICFRDWNELILLNWSFSRRAYKTSSDSGERVFG